MANGAIVTRAEIQKEDAAIEVARKIPSKKPEGWWDGSASGQVDGWRDRALRAERESAAKDVEIERLRGVVARLSPAMPPPTAPELPAQSEADLAAE